VSRQALGIRSGSRTTPTRRRPSAYATSRRCWGAPSWAPPSSTPRFAKGLDVEQAWGGREDRPQGGFTPRARQEIRTRHRA
jgi:hypothetical protein